jgi:hypothetical protein
MGDAVKVKVSIGGMVAPFSLESEIRFKDMTMAYMEAREQLFRDAAKNAFEAYTKYPVDDPKLVAHVELVTGKISIKNPVGEALDRAIGEALNHRSIGYFVELILENHESAKQTARALKRHAEHRGMKEDVFVWLDAQQGNFKSNEAAASAITKQQPIAHVTARDWYKEWKKLRSAGTP